jgi:hypothetical protein
VRRFPVPWQRFRNAAGVSVGSKDRPPVMAHYDGFDEP